MQVRVLAISKSSKPSVLALVRLELIVDATDETIIIDDARVLRNKAGMLWLAMPSYSVQLGAGRYDYQPAVTLSMALKRAAEDAVLPAFESWEKQQQGSAR